jgi:septal ring factor EnvC (AmiA/AmiB activator)
MEENTNMGNTGKGDPLAPETEIPPGGTGAPPTGATGAGAASTCASAQGRTLPTGAIRLRFGTPEPPTLPIKEGIGTNTGNSVEHQNRFAPLRQQGANSREQGSLNLSSSILRGGSSSASSSRRSRGRDPIPLTPEILQLLDRLEPDKGKQARLLTEHLTEQRTLPSTEQELQKLLERKAEKEIKRQQAAAEAAANKAAEEHMEAHEAAMTAHLAQQAMEAALAARATQDEAIAAGKAIMEAAAGDGSAHMMD